MSFKINKPLVSVNWLNENLDNKDLIILDCTIPKITSEIEEVEDEKQIKGAIFFDIKNVFSDRNAEFPNTILSPDKFEEQAQNLGINNDSIIVVYDDLGIYSSPRVWWMFNLMGFNNVAVLEGGFPAWKDNKYPTEKKKERSVKKGNFKAMYQANKIVAKENVLENIDSKLSMVLDARSKDRFYAKVAEPRKGVRSGSIPNSGNLPFGNILENEKMKSKEELITIFNALNPDKKELIFSCGSGITACILALGAESAGYKDYAVYDGSWTEWGSKLEYPITN